MTWQNSQLRPGGRAPADAGGQIPRAEVPSIQSSWLPPLRNSSPRGRGSRRGGPARDQLGAPVNPVRAGRAGCSRRGPSASRPRGPNRTARRRPAVPTDPSPLRLGGPNKESGGSRGGSAKAVKRQPASPAHRLPLGGRSSRSPGLTLSRSGAAARDRPGGEPQGGRGAPGPTRGRRPPPCLPAPPRSGVPADKARRRRGRSGDPGPPRRPPRNKRGQEPRKPGALMQ